MITNESLPLQSLTQLKKNGTISLYMVENILLRIINLYHFQNPLYVYVFECSVNETYLVLLPNLVYNFLSFINHNLKFICVHTY